LIGCFGNTVDLTILVDACTFPLFKLSAAKCSQKFCTSEGETYNSPVPVLLWSCTPLFSLTATSSKGKLASSLSPTSLSGLLTRPKCYKFQNSPSFWPQVRCSIPPWILDLILRPRGQSSSGERADFNATMRIYLA
jgi:hypothetical protein